MTAPRKEERFLRSTFYEQLVEHVFISELLQEAWFGFKETIEVLRSEIDAAGYDIVLECNGFIRHIQLKTSDVSATTSQQKVNVALAGKPGGCVIWVLRVEDPDARRVALSYRFFGGAPGKPLPTLDDFRVAKHTKANAQGVKLERPAIRLVPKGKFVAIADTRELLARLFGLGDA